MLDGLRRFLDVHTPLVSLAGYPISGLELVGTLFNLASVVLVARRSVWTWPVGLVGVVLFGILFWQIRLYSDLFEQVYFFGTGVYGWWVWTRPRRDGSDQGIQRLSLRQARWLFAGIAAATALLGWTTANLHLWLPTAFPEPASFPTLDAFTTILSFAAQLLMAHRYLENWLLWIVVDVVGIGLYLAKGVRVIALLYVLFLGLATYGLVHWRRVESRRELAG